MPPEEAQKLLPVAVGVQNGTRAHRWVIGLRATLSGNVLEPRTGVKTARLKLPYARTTKERVSPYVSCYVDRAQGAVCRRLIGLPARR
jgi:hypothetical protein